MTGRVEVTSLPVWRSRWIARTRIAFAITVVAILCVAGLRAIIAGAPAPASAPRAAPAGDLAAESFAEAFARAYLTWDATRAERHERQVARFISGALEPGAGITLPARGARQVVWTATVQDHRVSKERRVVTVAAQTTAELVYLAVPVQRDRRGFLFVASYPAFVGAPAANPKAAPSDEPEVEDGRLQAVARRAVTNYLAREESNLRADLHPSAVVSLPHAALRVGSVNQVTWAAPGRVAVELQAGDGDAGFTLRYELGVVKRDRWYVRSIEVNPTARGIG